MKIRGILFGLVCIFSNGVYAVETGPWTKVDLIYSTTKSANPYVSFKTDAMPGCNADRGGYLKGVDEKGKEQTFSVLMSALVAGRDVRVFYKFNDVVEGYSGWGLCDIEAVYIR